MERLGLSVDGNPLAGAPLLGVSAVEDRLASEFGGESRVMFAEVSSRRHSATTTAIAKPRGAQRSCDLDALSVTPSLTRACARARGDVWLAPGHGAMNCLSCAETLPKRVGVSAEGDPVGPLEIVERCNRLVLDLGAVPSPVLVLGYQQFGRELLDVPQAHLPASAAAPSASA